jgi:hypothetical protein
MTASMVLGSFQSRTPGRASPRKVIERSGELRHYEMLWDTEANEMTIIVTGKIEQNALDRTQTAMFNPPNELAFRLAAAPVVSIAASHHQPQPVLVPQSRHV